MKKIIIVSIITLFVGLGSSTVLPHIIKKETKEPPIQVDINKYKTLISGLEEKSKVEFKELTTSYAPSNFFGNNYVKKVETESNKKKDTKDGENTIQDPTVATDNNTTSSNSSNSNLPD